MTYRNIVLRGAAVVALGLLIASSVPVDAVACTCVKPLSPREALEQSHAVFSGTVSRIDTTENNLHGLRVSIAVDQIWKGDVAREATVVTAPHGAACGFHFSRGEEYLIYARKLESRLTTSICSRTAALDEAQVDIAALEHGGGLCGTPVDAVTAQIFVFLILGLAAEGWPVYV